MRPNSIEFRAPMGKVAGFWVAGVLEKVDFRRIPLTHAVLRSTREDSLMNHAFPCGKHNAGVCFWKRLLDQNLDFWPFLPTSTWSWSWSWRPSSRVPLCPPYANWSSRSQVREDLALVLEKILIFWIKKFPNSSIGAIREILYSPEAIRTPPRPFQIPGLSRAAASVHVESKNPYAESLSGNSLQPYLSTFSLIPWKVFIQSAETSARPVHHIHRHQIQLQSWVSSPVCRSFHSDYVLGALIRNPYQNSQEILSSPL